MGLCWTTLQIEEGSERTAKSDLRCNLEFPERHRDCLDNMFPRLCEIRDLVLEICHRDWKGAREC